MRENRLPQFLIVIGVLANLALLFINLSPDRPHLARLRTAKVLLRADPPRARWVKENLLAEFSAAHDVRFEVVTAHSFEEVLSLLKAEKEKPTGLLLASIDSAIADELNRADTLRPIEDAVTPLVLEETVSQYLPEAMVRCHGPDQKIWFLPKRMEVDVAVYLEPAVEDAYLHWESDRAAIDAALAAANGVGLPRHYRLEKNPGEWDSYDQFVTAWYWAHHPAPWADSTTELAPRMAVRTGDNDDALNDLMAAFYRHGLTEAQFGKADAPPIIDALQWESLFRKHHLLAAACESKEGVDSDGVNDLFKARKIAWAPINQEDSLWLHGGSQRSAEPGLPRASELGWAMLPSGASLEMKDGNPARRGRSFSFTRTHLWAVPTHAPDPLLAFQLAAFLTQRSPQLRETEAQGLLPIRHDLRAEYPILFRLAWMQRILDASYRQVAGGSGALPPRVKTDGLDDLYIQVRSAVGLGRAEPLPVTYDATAAAVREAFHGK